MTTSLEIHLICLGLLLATDVKLSASLTVYQALLRQTAIPSVEKISLGLASEDF